MNQDRFAGICRQFTGTMKERWGNLTNDPLVAAAGIRDQHEGRIRERYGVSQENAARQLEDFFARNRNWDLSSH